MDNHTLEMWLKKVVILKLLEHDRIESECLDLTNLDPKSLTQSEQDNL